MREIRFRGLTKNLVKDPQGTPCHAMVYGNLIHRGGDCYYIALYETDYTGQAVLSTYSVDPDTIGQFTGFRDKDGREIYEGDIVEVTDEDDTYRCLIEWLLDGFGGRALDGKEPCCGLELVFLQQFTLKVIGNKIVNPELIGEINGKKPKFNVGDLVYCDGVLGRITAVNDELNEVTLGNSWTVRLDDDVTIRKAGWRDEVRILNGKEPCHG